MSKKMISIIIPLFNEQDNLLELYQRIEAVFNKIQIFNFEVVYVDDGSTDQTWSCIRKLTGQHRPIQGVRLSRNFGQQVALTAGLDLADGDAVIMMDGDLQHPPELIEELLAKWQEGHDVVYTIRKTNKAYNPIQKCVSDLYYFLFRTIARMDMPKGVVDFRLISRQVNEQLKKFPERTRFVRGLVNWVGFHSVAISYTAEKRYKGITKYSFWKLSRLATTSIMSFSSFPLYVSGLIGILVALFSLVYILYTVYVRFFTDSSLPGQTTIIVSILFLGGVQLIAIGVLGGYIAKIYEEVKQRPLYIIQEKAGREA